MEREATVSRSANKQNAHTDALPKLKLTRNPIEVEDHLVELCKACYKDHYTKGVEAMDPRNRFKPYDPPYFDPIKNGISEADKKFLTQALQESTLANNIVQFNNNRNKIIARYEDETSSLYPVLLKSLGECSREACQTFDVAEWEEADRKQDTMYVIRALIGSHAATVAAGMSSFEVDARLDERNLAYLQCVRGSDSMEKYLLAFQAHQRAIRAQDPAISSKGEGGVMGTLAQQVNRFFRGSGADILIELHMNGRLGKENEPSNLAEVCTLLRNWTGPITTGVKKLSSSIMSSSTYEEKEVYATITTPGHFPHPLSSEQRKEAIAKRRQDNADLRAKGIVKITKPQWTKNVGQTCTPCVSTNFPTFHNPKDTGCGNCGLRYHPQGNRMLSRWYNCGEPWDEVSLAAVARWSAEASNKTKSSKPRNGATATPPTTAPVVQNNVAQVQNQTYSAAEHAAAMAVRAAFSERMLNSHAPASVTNNYAQVNSAFPSTSTDQQGWVAPHHESGPYMYIGTTHAKFAPMNQPQPIGNADPKEPVCMPPGFVTTQRFHHHRVYGHPKQWVFREYPSANYFEVFPSAPKRRKRDLPQLCEWWHLHGERKTALRMVKEGLHVYEGITHNIFTSIESRRQTEAWQLSEWADQQRNVVNVDAIYLLASYIAGASILDPRVTTPLDWYHKLHESLPRSNLPSAAMRYMMEHTVPRLNRPGTVYPYMQEMRVAHLKHCLCEEIRERLPLVPRPYEGAAQPIGYFVGTSHFNAVAESSIKTTFGVPGVVYPRLPTKSLHRDPAHKITNECNLVAWMYDTGAGIAAANSKYGLTNIHQLARPVIITGITGSSITVTMAGDLDGVEVLYHPGLSANCLTGSTIVDAQWNVEYLKAHDAYRITTVSGHLLLFQRHQLFDKNGVQIGVTAHYINHPQLAYEDPDRQPDRAPIQVHATTVAGNLSMLTPQDAKAAKTAQRYLTNMGGSIAHAISRLPLYRGVDITPAAIRNAALTFGQQRNHAKGASTSVQDVAVTTELPLERPKPVPQSLAIDLCKILGQWFVLGVFLPCHYLVAVEVPDHTSDTILAAVKTMYKAALRRNFDVMQIQSDGERGIHSAAMGDFCAKYKIKLLRVGSGQHEATVERMTRTLKAEVRSIASRVMPGHLPSTLVTHLVHASVTSINCRLTSALTGALSPQQLWNDTPQLHAQDIDFAFGDLASAKTPNHKNDVAPRADTVMILSPNYNGLHGYDVFKLGSKQVVIRNHNTLTHIPWTATDIDIVESLGQQDPAGVVLPRQEQGTDTGAEAAMEEINIDEDWITNHPAVGTQVSRKFRGKKYIGTVSKVLPMHIDDKGATNPITYKILYADGDEEDLDDDEYQAAKVSNPRGLGVRPSSPRIIQVARISVSQAMKDQPVETAAAIRHELGQMLSLGVFEPVHFDKLTDVQRKAAIRSSFFIKLKYAPSGDFIKCKGRLVAGGNTQDRTLYTNISSPTATPTATLFVAGDAAAHGKHVASMDIGGAYLNAPMAPTGVTVHMIIEPRLATVLADLQPSYRDYLRRDGSVAVVLIKALYGTVEAARLWYDVITSTLIKYGCKPNAYERCVLNKSLPNQGTLTVVLYVDDLLVTCTTLQPIIDLKAELMRHFPEVAYHTGSQIDYVGMTLDFETQPGAAVITMKHLIDDVVANAPDTKMHSTPANPELFNVDQLSPRLMPSQEAIYRTFVAKLLYCAKRNRPDILLAISFLTTRVNHCTIEDMEKLHRVLGYIRATPNRGTVVEFGTAPIVRAYIDASYGVHDRDGKSHTGASVVFGKGGPLYVTSVKQAIVTKSSTEAELVAFSDVASEVICLRNFSIGQGYSTAPAIIYQDNDSTMALIANGVPCSKRSRHIDIRNFWMAEKVQDGSITVVRCPTEIMWANFLTKPVTGSQFVVERQGLTNWFE